MSKTIVITGAGVGLGRALARRFAADGENVVLLGRTPAKVDAAAAQIGERAMALGCDVGSPDAVRGTFAKIAQRHKKIDVLINNAAVFEPFTIEEATDEQLIASAATNLVGPMLCARSAIPLMQRGAHIINVSSEAVETPLPYLIAYQSAKAGLERFSRGLQQELEPKGIRVSVVRAGQMGEEGKVWNIDPAAALRFAQGAAAVGLNVRERPITHFTSVTQIFRSLVDLPADLHVASVVLTGRAP